MIGELILKTKFIGLEGFNEIESLSTTKKAAVKCVSQVSFSYKAVRFAKRASVYFAKSLKKKSADLVNRQSVKHTAKSTSVRKTRSVLDKCYIDNRNGSQNEFSGSLIEASKSVFGVPANKKYARMTAVQSCRTHSILKKRAVLAVVACAVTVMLSCVTVASALDTSDNAVKVITSANPVFASQTTPMSNNAETQTSSDAFLAATADEASMQLSNEAYLSITKAVAADELATGISGLYIDGELIGATNDIQGLNDALNQILVDYKEGYDDETTTEFANDVVVRSGNFSEDDIMSVSDIIQAADGRFSISLSTDIVYTREIDYETITEYDDSKASSYKKVTTEGKKGEEQVTIRTTFTDGMQTDAVEVETKVLTEAVDEVVVRGSKDGVVEDNSSSQSSGSSSSSTGTFSWPVPYTHNITSYYEWRWGRMHWGIDISAGGVYGQAITASDGGTVVFAGDKGDGYGNYVIIDHGNGYQTLYAHCSSLAVSYGQYVSKGDTIAYVGSTGNSTGPHLHFEVIYNSNKLNPLQFVS